MMRAALPVLAAALLCAPAARAIDGLYVPRDAQMFPEANCDDPVGSETGPLEITLPWLRMPDGPVCYIGPGRPVEGIEAAIHGFDCLDPETGLQMPDPPDILIAPIRDGVLMLAENEPLILSRCNDR